MLQRRLNFRRRLAFARLLLVVLAWSQALLPSRAQAQAPTCREALSSDLADLNSSPSDNADRAIEYLNDRWSLRNWYGRDVDREVMSTGINPATKKSELDRAVKESLNQVDLASRLNRWVQSDSQALVVFELLLELKLKSHREVAEYLLTHNEYFRRANPVRGPPGSNALNGLVTFAFEKEGANPLITESYRDPQVSETEWFSMTPQTRYQRLNDINPTRRLELSSNVIAPTSRKSHFLGGFMVELETRFSRGWSWEVSHKRYEINRERAMEQVWDVATQLGESHSFHFHVVFEMPRKYLSFDQFKIWHKHVSDYLYLRGLEEGLHGNYLTRLPNLKRDLSWRARAKLALDIEGKPRPEIFEAKNPEDVGAGSLKQFTLGLRSGIYGSASSLELKRIGLELRDVTRDLDKLDAYTVQLTSAVSEYRWEKLLGAEKRFGQQTLRLVTYPEQSRTALNKTGLQTFAIKMFLRAEETVALPLTRFEDGLYFSYVSGQFERVSPKVRARILHARAEYEKSLMNLQEEIRARISRRESTHLDDVKAAIRMSISEWAKIAQVSELFRSF